MIDYTGVNVSDCAKRVGQPGGGQGIRRLIILGANGVVNAAPFSMFNMIGEDPPILMISINRLQDGQLKDTAANILHNGEFVVHMSDEPMAQKMHDCGASFPSDVSELSAVGLTPVPSHSVVPPRIQEAPIAFECVLHETLETPSRYVFIGRIVWLAARDGLIDTEAWRVNLRDYRPVARFGASFYTRTEDRFSLSERTDPQPLIQTDIDRL